MQAAWSSERLHPSTGWSQQASRCGGISTESAFLEATLPVSRDEEARKDLPCVTEVHGELAPLVGEKQYPLLSPPSLTPNA